MSPKTAVSTYIVSGLEVSNLNGERYYSLPDVYTQKAMPVNATNITKTEFLRNWSYLDHINVPEIPAEVELLIGTNASQLMEPWEVVNSQKDGPFAIKTLLGWVVSGSGKTCKANSDSVSVNLVSVESLELLLKKQYEHDFNERDAEDKVEMSREEARFIEIMEQSVKLQDGHYSLKLPFKTKEVALPNNHCVALQRLTSLKRKMERNEKFHQEYTKFLEDVISNGFAEMVPQNELRAGEVNVFYIPHHGVYHPRKGKLRVVFDCGAKFKDDHRSSFPQEVIDTVHRNFDVDDCLKSSKSVEKAVKIAHDLSDLCHKGGFHLTQWISNSQDVLQAIPEKEHSKNRGRLLELAHAGRGEAAGGQLHTLTPLGGGGDRDREGVKPFYIFQRGGGRICREKQNVTQKNTNVNSLYRRWRPYRFAGGVRVEDGGGGVGVERGREAPPLGGAQEAGDGVEGRGEDGA
ncbi:hypothetical protein N1851_010280 [Merluccius polli]|uniref:Uncharacterized protein n=1 Tax=Merluccius polli TaxID=89951 RepID=A0AA47N032_MERPO|nr:hypothetical protein N1851_010280 [Merluccius polli]